MQRMSRAQRLLLIYILLELEKPRQIIQRITRRPAPITSSLRIHGNEYHSPDFISTAYTDANAISAVEGEATLDLTGAVTIAGTTTLSDNLTIAGASKQIILHSARIAAEAAVSDYLTILDAVGVDHGSLRVKNIQLFGAFWFNAAGEFRGSTAGNDVLLRTYSGFPPTLTTVATMEGGTPAFSIQKAGDITMLDQKMMQFGTYTDAQRPAAGTTGRWIFNTDDGMPNYDDGTDWRDINGNIT